MNKIAAIYVIRNKINCKFYLGSTMNYERRRNDHLVALRNKKHYNFHLQNAWNKYGEKNFRIFPVEKFPQISGDELIKKEGEYIEQLNLIKIGYNIQNPPTNQFGKNNLSWKGGPVKVTCALCGKAFKLSRGHYTTNKKLGFEAYCSKRCKYKGHSKNISGEKNYWYDRKHTDKTRKKMSETAKKRFKNPLEIEKMRKMAERRWKKFRNKRKER